MSDIASREVLETLIASEAAPLLNYFVRRVDESHDAADLVSETLLVAWRKRASIPTDKDEARMWLYGVARRVLATHWRARRRRDALNDRLRQDLDAASCWEHEEPSFDSVRSAIAELKPLDRELITLVYWDGFNLTEAAKLLKLKPATARSRLARSRAALRQQLALSTGRAPSIATA